MDFNATIDLIIKDLDDARQIIEDLKKYPGVPLLQIELAKAKCKSAGEVISLLKNQKDYIPGGSEPFFGTVQPKEQDIPEEKKTTISSFISNLPIEQPEKKSESIENSLHPEESEKETGAMEGTSPPVREETLKTGKKVSESSIIADKFSHMTNRFNERLGSMKSDEDVSDILKSKPLSNLSEAIGINDKFLFIREIFDGNKETYTRAISQIDNAASLKDARAVIMSYTGDNTENEAIKLLLDLVKRKFPSHE
jgi:hypothetical protein